MTVISSFFILEFHYKSYSLCTNPLNMNDNQTNRTPWPRWTTATFILTMPTVIWSMLIQAASSRTAHWIPPQSSASSAGTRRTAWRLPMTTFGYRPFSAALDHVQAMLAMVLIGTKSRDQLLVWCRRWTDGKDLRWGWTAYIVQSVIVSKRSKCHWPF